LQIKIEFSSKNLVFIFFTSFLFETCLGLVSFAQDSVNGINPNKFFSFKRIFIEKTKDNLDGVYEPIVEEAFEEVFRRNPRFEIVTQKKESDTILETTIEKRAQEILIEQKLLINVEGFDSKSFDSKSASNEKGGALFGGDANSATDIVTDSAAKTLGAVKGMSAKGALGASGAMGALGAANPTTNAGGVDRSKSQKNASAVLFAENSEKIKTTSDSEEIKQTLKKSLKTLLKKIPFYATVTGRDGDVLTLDLGSINGLRRGDIVQISKVSSFTQHPLLKNIIDYRLDYVGSAKVQTVEESISFAQVVSESSDDKILNLYKVTGVEVTKEESKTENNKQDEIRMKLVPEIGYVGGGVVLGTSSLSNAQNNGTTITSGSNLAYGFSLNSELWLTKNWFLDFDLLFGFSSLQMQNEITKAKSGNFSSSTTLFDVDLGYRHYVWGIQRGPSVFGRIGYGSYKFSAPSDTTMIMGGRKVNGIKLGVGGSLPVANRGYTHLFMTLDFAISPEFELTGADITKDPTQDISAALVKFSAGLRHNFYTNMALQVGFYFNSASVEYTGGAQKLGPSSSSSKIYGVMPMLLYYF
jgi:hypothetical protein